MLSAIQNARAEAGRQNELKDSDAANAETVKRMDAVNRTRLIAAKQGVDTFARLWRTLVE